MPLIDAIISPLGKLIDKIIPDPRERDRAKLELLRLEGDQEAAQIGQQMQAIIAEANSHDPWTSRARPSLSASAAVSRMSAPSRRPAARAAAIQSAV